MFWSFLARIQRTLELVLLAQGGFSLVLLENQPPYSPLMWYGKQFVRRQGSKLFKGKGRKTKNSSGLEGGPAIAALKTMEEGATPPKPEKWKKVKYQGKVKDIFSFTILLLAKPHFFIFWNISTWSSRRRVIFLNWKHVTQDAFCSKEHIYHRAHSPALFPKFWAAKKRKSQKLPNYSFVSETDPARSVVNKKHLQTQERNPATIQHLKLALILKQES